MVTHFKLCLATATHNLKWVNITHICLIWDEPLENVDFVPSNNDFIG